MPDFRRRVLLSTAVASAAWAACAAVRAAVPPPDRVRRPVPGERWRYRFSEVFRPRDPAFLVFEVLAVSDEGIRDLLTVERARNAYRDEQTFGSAPRATWRYPADRTLLDFSPYLLAQTGATPGARMALPDIPYTDGSPVPERLSARALRFERVETPAGVFEALKVEVWHQRNIDSMETEGRAVYWYAPAAGRYVMAVHDASPRNDEQFGVRVRNRMVLMDHTLP